MNEHEKKQADKNLLAATKAIARLGLAPDASLVVTAGVMVYLANRMVDNGDLPADACKEFRASLKTACDKLLEATI